jgi:hypothetical protein
MSDIYFQKNKPRAFDYKWLLEKQPVAKVGDSIYIYEVN